MKNRILLFLLAVAFFTCNFLFADTHVIENDGAVYISASDKRMNERIEQSAVQYEQYAPVSRIAFSDFCFGASLDEYAKLNSYGVFMITAQCQEKEEIPFKRVYVKSGGKEYPLQFIFSKPVKVPGGKTETVFGKYRMNLFYLIPYNYIIMTGEICIDWGTNRVGFPLTKLPEEKPIDYTVHDEMLTPSINRHIDRKFLSLFLKREYSFANSDAAEALKNIGAL